MLTAAPTPPLASGGGPLEVLTLPLTLLVVAWAYWRRARHLAEHGRGVPGWRQACFAGGLLTLVVAVVPPVSTLSDQLFSVHMAEHLLIGDIAALLLVLGMTGPLLAPVLRVPIVDRLRWLMHPVVAFGLWAVNLYVWHIPALYQGALRHDVVHALQHALFLFCGANLWMALLGPLPKPEWFGTFGRLLYVIVVRLTATVLGNVFIWAGRDIYPYYRSGTARHGISALSDQTTAGAVMMIEGSLVTIGLFCWLFMRAARESEERQELLDLARREGVALDERRAARAVRAGRGEELRRRILQRDPRLGPPEPRVGPPSPVT